VNSTKLLAGSRWASRCEKNIPTKGEIVAQILELDFMEFLVRNKNNSINDSRTEFFFSQGSNTFLPFGTFEDDFPFPKVEYVSFDIYLMVKLRLARLFPPSRRFPRCLLSLLEGLNPASIE